MTTPDPYGRITFRDRPLDRATSAALTLVEKRLGYGLTVVQGIGGAAASGGTHTDGRAVDLTAYDHDAKVKALRDLGFAAWYRPTLPGVWGEHVHAVSIFVNRQNTRGISDAGFAQIGKYDRGEDGLSNPPTPDPNPYRPSPAEIITLDQYRRVMATNPNLYRPAPETNVTRARDAIVEAIHNLGTASAFLEDTPETREVAHDLAEEIRRDRRELRALLKRMPPR